MDPVDHPDYSKGVIMNITNFLKSFSHSVQSEVKMWTLTGE